MNPAGTQERGLAVVAGVVVAVVVLTLCGAGGFVIGRNRVQKAKRGWSLVPAVTATRDLPVGAVLKRGDLVESTAPNQFVTAQVRRDASGLEGQTLLAPIATGELAHRGHLSRAWPISRECLNRAAATVISLGLVDDVPVRALLSDLHTKSGW
ncbi:MAG: SAF domain-containing protein [Myxococcaceae bacterium]